MSRFIESIRISNKSIANLSLHQERVNRALQAHPAHSQINLKDHIKVDDLDNRVLYKCRVVYDLEQVLDVQYIPYKKRMISSLGIVSDNSIEYQHKYENREHIGQLLASSDTDDIIIIKNGYVTDASYTNLVFFDGKDWYTSNTPLLRGVQREKLIRNDTIREAVITKNDIPGFVAVRLINAMIPWEEAIEIPISKVFGLT